MQINDNRVSPAGFKTASTAVLLIATCGFLHAEEGTSVQRRACTPDVFRLCGEFIPNPTAITYCLEHKKSRLNRECRAVIEGRLR